MSLNLSRKLAQNLSLLPATILLLIYLLSITDQLVVHDIEIAKLIFYGAFLGYFLIPLLAIVEIRRARWLAALFNIFVFSALADKALALGIISVGSFLATLLSPVVTVILTSFALPIAYLYWRQTRYIIFSEERPKKNVIGFADYVGQPEVLKKAKRIAFLLQKENRQFYEQAGGDRINGVLFVGSSGIGKTHLARVIAAEANLPLFYIDVSSLRSIFGMVARGEVSRIYKEARSAAQQKGAAIVYLGNLDLLDLDGQSSLEEEGDISIESLLTDSDAGLINCIKSEMTAYNIERSLGMAIVRSSRKLFGKPTRPPYVLTIGEVQDLKTIPPSLQRLEYFSDVLEIPPLTVEATREILQRYLPLIPHDTALDLVLLARLAPEATPAGIKAWLNRALQNAMVEGRKQITMKDFPEVHHL